MCVIHFYRGLYCLKEEGAKGVVIIAVPVMRIYNMSDYYTCYTYYTDEVYFLLYRYPLSTIVLDIY